MKRGLGFRRNLDDECVSALQEAQRLLEEGRTLPDFLKVEDEAFAVPMGTGEVALPAGFIREVDDEGLRFVGDTPNDVRFLPKDRFDVLTQTFVDDDTAEAPSAYKIRKATVAFFPYSRDRDYTLYWSYYKNSVSLATDVADNEWLNNAPEALIGKAGVILAMDLRDPDSVVLFQRMHDEAWKGSIAAGFLREEANRPLRMGSKL